MDNLILIFNLFIAGNLHAVKGLRLHAVMGLHLRDVDGLHLHAVIGLHLHAVIGGYLQDFFGPSMFESSFKNLSKTSPSAEDTSFRTIQLSQSFSDF